MRKLTRAIFLGFIGAFLFTAVGHGMNTEWHEPHLQEKEFLVLSQDFYFDQDNMMVVIDGYPHAVQTLQRYGDCWQVEVSGPAGYCREGHNLCNNCGTCHKPGCRYYIRHCNLWN